MIDAVHPCRVCLSEGTWNIFGSNVINDEMCTVASINHIRDKLQYVTQLQMNADDGLPFRICELCIVQLNLAYRFKQLAADSDSKLRGRHNAGESPSPNIPNALAYGAETVVQDDPEVVSFVLKQEDEDETPSEISLGPRVVSEPCTDHHTPISEASVSTVTPNPGTAPAMVYLQNDIINPAEDEAFINDIIKKEVISMPWPIISKNTTTGTDKSPSTSPPQSKPPSPKQVGAHEKPSKASPPKRRRSASEQEEKRINEIENRSEKQRKLAKKKAKRATDVPVKAAAEQTQQVSRSGAAKESSKPSKATLRKKRLQKMLDSLRIDMVDDKLQERHSRQELIASLQSTSGSAIVPMKRRNSICVASLPPWM